MRAHVHFLAIGEMMCSDRRALRLSVADEARACGEIRRDRRAGLLLASLLCLLVVGGRVTASAAAAEQPLAEWHFDQESGASTPDASGHGNDLALEGAGVLAGEGRWGGALGLGGGGVEHARLKAASQLEPTNVTVLAWVKKKSGEAPGAYTYVLGKGGDDFCNASSYALYTGAGKGLEFYFYDGSAFHSSPAVNPATIWDGQWHAVAGTYDGSTVRLYVDGVQVGSGTPASASIDYARTKGDLTVGDYPESGCGSPQIRADVDEARIYGSALSVAQIAFLENPASTKPPELSELESGGGPGGGGGGATADKPTAAISAAIAGAKFKVGGSTLQGPLTAWLGAKQSAPSAGASIVRYLWDLDGNGTTDVECGGESPAIFVQFPRAATYSALVTVEDSSGATATARRSILVKASRAGTSSAPVASGTKFLAARPALARVVACMTQLETQHPSTADCVRSFGFEAIDVNVRSSRCFKIVARRLGSAKSSAVAHTSLIKGLSLALDFEASVAGPVSLNGIPIPLPGSFTSHYDSAESTIGLGDPKIAFEVAGREVSVGRLDLNRKTDSSLVNGRWTYALGAVDLSGLGNIGGLGGTGAASLEFVEGSTQLNVGLKLPRVFSMPDGKPAEGTIQALASNTRPFHISHFHIHLPYVDLGPVVGKNLDLEYDESSDTWSGGAAFLLPGTEPPLELDASPREGTDYGVQFSNGALKHAGAEVDFGALSPEIFPGVFLSNLRFTIGTDPIRVFGGGTVNTAKIVYVDGDILAIYPEPGESYEVPAGLQGFQRLAGRTIDSPSLAAGGDVFFRVAGFDLPLGNAFVLYTFPGRIEFAGGVDVPLGVFHATGEVSGFADAASRTFNSEGHGRFCVEGLDACLGADMLVSSDGIAGCGSLQFLFFSVNAGAGYHWGGSFHIYFDDCDVGPYRVYANASKASASAAGASFKLPAGLPVADVELKGASAAPDVTLRGPNGQVLSTSGRQEGKESGLVFVRADAGKTAYIGLVKPAGGTWTVTENAGSSPVVGTSVANGQPAPSVRARVTGSGPIRTLSYDVAPREGQKVLFTEQGVDTYRQIGQAKGTHGSFRFKPAFGSAGRRKLVALVLREGVTSHILKLGTYNAPGWRHPSRPQKLRVSRKGGVLQVRWQRQPGVRSYVVEVRTSDGVPRLTLVKAAGAKIRGVSMALRGTVTVAGIDASGSRGPTRSVNFRATR